MWNNERKRDNERKRAGETRLPTGRTQRKRSGEARQRKPQQREKPLPFAHQLAETLGEAVGTTGWRQIVRTATVCGEAALRMAAAETLRLLDAGGLPTLDGTRQRTPGGVLLRLVREAVTPDEAVRIFGWRARVQAYQSSPEFRAQFARLAEANRIAQAREKR